MSSAPPPRDDKSEPFPSLSPIASTDAEEDSNPANLQDVASRQRPSSSARGTNSTRRTRSSSLLQSIMESNPPLGAWHAIGEDTAKGPTIPEIKNGSYTAQGWSHEGQLEKRKYDPHDIHQRRLSRASSQSLGSKNTRPNTSSTAAKPDLRATGVQDEPTSTTVKPEKDSKRDSIGHSALPLSTSNTHTSTVSNAPVGPNETGEYPNGYRFPKKHTWQQSCAIFGAAFWKFFWTIKGFLITIYALNVVAWGAMIFFLLIPGATPAMCKSYPDCEDKRYSARQIWIENCSQILTALFCVTAFGLLPWRLRDFYYMIRYQVFGDYKAHRKLAGFYRGWYRLPGSQKLPEFLGPPAEPENLKAKSIFSFKKIPSDDVENKRDEALDEEIAALEANNAVPLPPWSMAPAPLTGVRARPTKFSAMATMIWMYIWNTLFQVGLCVVMWRYNRFERNKPYFTALVALFITLGCFTGIGAGIIVGKEGKVIKETEGIAVEDYDVLESPQDFRDRMEKKEKKDAKKKKTKEKTKDAVRGTKS